MTRASGTHDFSGHGAEDCGPVNEARASGRSKLFWEKRLHNVTEGCLMRFLRRRNCQKQVHATQVPSLEVGGQCRRLGRCRSTRGCAKIQNFVGSSGPRQPEIFLCSYLLLFHLDSENQMSATTDHGAATRVSNQFWGRLLAKLAILL